MTGVYVYGAGKAVVPTSEIGGLQKIVSQPLEIGDFTDNENTTGYIDLTPKLPAMAVPVGWKAIVTGAFDGDTTAVMQVGVDGDLDRFSGVTTVSCLEAGTVGAPSANDAALSSDEQTVRVTVTGGSDFTDIVTEGNGAMLVELYYFLLN